MKKIWLSIVCVALASVCHAQVQEFVAETPLQPVTVDGFYTIEVSPDATAYLTPGFANLRLIDNAGKEVPYIITEEAPFTVAQKFEPYEIIEKKQEPGCCTSLVLHNPKLSELNSMHLVFKNADVVKEATLLGSDDREKWYALKQNFTFYTTPSTRETSEVRIVDFPLTNYKYYKLHIDDSASAPLNILDAGYVAQYSETGKYTAVPIMRVWQADSLKRTYVYMQFDQPRMIDKVTIRMKGSPFFLRQATLYEQRTTTNKKGATVHYYDAVEQVEINSRHATTLELTMAKPTRWMLAIENENNPALQIDNIAAFQLNRTVTAYLKKDEHYTVKFGDNNMPPHQYDLSYFRDSLPGPAAVLQMGTIEAIQKQAAVPSTTIFTSRVYIWIAVIAVIVVLAFMSWKLLNEAAARKES